MKLPHIIPRLTLPKKTIWHDAIRMLMRDDPVGAGEDGPTNIPLQQISDRTEYLKENVEILSEQVNAGFILSSSFEQGYSITLANEVLLYEADGQYYRWTGNLPKDVPANSTPDSTGGVIGGAWVLIGDGALRSELALNDGAKMVGFNGDTVEQALNWLSPLNTDMFYVDNYGAVGDGVTDDTKAVQDALTAANDNGGGIVKFTANKDYMMTYTAFFGSNTVIDWTGTKISFNPIADGSCFMPETFDDANEGHWTENVVFRGGTVKGVEGKGNFIGLNKSKYVLVENITVEWLHWHLVDTGACKYLTVRNIINLKARSHCIQLDSAIFGKASWAVSKAGEVLPIAYNSDTSTWWTFPQYVHIYGCTFQNLEQPAIDFHEGNVRDVTITGNAFTNCKVGIMIERGSNQNVIIANNQFVDCVRSINCTSNIYRMSITNNFFSASNGLYRHINIENPYQNLTGRRSLISIMGNSLYNGKQSILVENVSDLIVSSNRIASSDKFSTGVITEFENILTYCIKMSGCDHYSISNNDFSNSKVNSILAITDYVYTNSENEAITVKCNGIVNNNVSLYSSPFLIAKNGGWMIIKNNSVSLANAATPSHLFHITGIDTVEFSNNWIRVPLYAKNQPLSYFDSCARLTINGYATERHGSLIQLSINQCALVSCAGIVDLVTTGSGADARVLIDNGTTLTIYDSSVLEKDLKLLNTSKATVRNVAEKALTAAT